MSDLHRLRVALKCAGATDGNQFHESLKRLLTPGLSGTLEMVGQAAREGAFPTKKGRSIWL